MAYYTDTLENEDELDESAPVQQSGQSGTLSAGQGAQGGAAPQGASAKPDRGSNFVGISNYLNANKQQAGKLGDQAAGVIQNSAQDARQNVTDLTNTFNQKAGSAVQNDENLLGRVGEAEKLNDQEKQQIKTQYNAQYQGPNSLQDLNDQYTKANQSLNKAQTNINSAGTEEGRKGLVTQINDKKRTQGITNFDNLLLQAGGGRERVEQAAQANQDLTGDVLGAQNQTAQEKAAQIKAQNDATRTATQGAVQGAQSAMTSDIAKRLEDFRNKITAQNNALTQDLGDDAYSLDASNLGSYGLDDGRYSYGINPTEYLKQGDINQINTGNIASRDEFLRSQALAELSGGQSYLDQSKIDQAGTADQYAPGVDKEKFQKDLTKKEQDFNNLWSTTPVSQIGQGIGFVNQVMPSGSTAGFRNSYANVLQGLSPQQLEAKLPELEQAARSGWHDPTLTVSDLGKLTTNIRKYLNDLKTNSLGKKFQANK